MTEKNILSLIIGSCPEIAKPVVETGCRLIDSLLGEPIKIAGSMLADQIYFWQWQNRIKIANRAKEIMAENNITEKVLPPGFLLPLLEAAGNIDEPTLQEMWARLLSYAVSDAKYHHPSYIKVLSELSPLDVKLLHEIYTDYKNNSSSDGKLKHYRLNDACISLEIKNDEALKSSYNLVRLGIIEIQVKWDILNNLLRSGSNELVVLSLYGLHFVEACGAQSALPGGKLLG